MIVRPLGSEIIWNKHGNTPPELLTRKTTVEIPQNINFYLAKDETSPRLECKYAVKTDID